MTTALLVLNAVVYLMSVTAMVSLAKTMTHRKPASLWLHWVAAFGTAVVCVVGVMALLGLTDVHVSTWVLVFTPLPALFPLAMTRWYGDAAREIEGLPSG